MKQLNILLIGDESSGKTSLISSYVNNNNSVKKTIGFDIFIKNIKDQKFCFYDVSGHSRFNYVFTKYINCIDLAIIIYDITQRESFNNIPFWINIIHQYYSQTIPILIIGNKCDQEHLRSISYNDAMKFSNKFNSQYAEVSCFDTLIFHTILIEFVSKYYYCTDNNNIIHTSVNKKNKKCTVF